MKRRFFPKKAVAKKTTPDAPPSASEPSDFLTPEYKTRILENSVLGTRGFTIPKSALCAEDLVELKRDLSVKKIAPAGSSGMAAVGADDTVLFMYRENDKKIYIPRYYAEKRYGAARNTKIPAGEEMETVFKGSVRDYQETIINTYLNHVRERSNSGVAGGGGLLSVPCGAGKCLARDTEILMYDGSIRAVQDINVGDVIMGDDSTPRNVLSLARGRETMYRVRDETNIGFPSEYVVNESHILTLKSFCDERPKIIDISVQDYLKHKNKEYLCGFRVPIKFSKTTIHLDSIEITGDGPIPTIYKINSRTVRYKTLCLIIDKYGSYSQTGGFTVTHKNAAFIDDVIFLARSLGFTIKSKQTCAGAGAGAGMGMGDDAVVTLYRIFVNRSISSYVDNNYRISVEKLPEDDYYGFEIDGNRRFVLGDFTVTHNTVMAIKIATDLRKKTLIIVHKEFLMNQWIERIHDFCTGARIGKIQGDVFDVEGKDFVIGMLQTLYMRPFPENAFHSFGLLVIDETHRICSEQFSKALFKINPLYTLGISATIERKDGLESVLNMFVGDILFHKDRDGDDPVCVRAVEYVSTDEEFNKVEHDYRGNVKYSTMISKLCDNNARSEFVIRLIRDLLEENTEQQIMVIAHNKSVLHYIHDAIRDRGIATVGYYVGGMRERDLKATEEKTVVIATYSMAAEALDIKTLSTLVMVTPKTDIIQTVGRILRMKHQQPVVVDVVDTHDVFQNQWRQRRVFYKKCNYRIRYIKSPNYAGMNFDWDEDRTWRRVFEPAATATAPDGAVAAAEPGSDDDDDDNNTSCASTKSAVAKKCLINIAALKVIPDHII